MDTKKKEVISELVKQKGIVTIACNNVGLSRSTFYSWLESDANFAKEVEDAREQAIDYVESKLFNLIENDDTTATIFFLKTRGKKRGYVERQEFAGVENAPLSINLIKKGQ